MNDQQDTQNHSDGGIKHRVSNVLAWAGVIWLVVVTLFLGSLGWSSYSGVVLAYLFFALPVWLPCVIANYLMVGSFRIFPWKNYQHTFKES